MKKQLIAVLTVCALLLALLLPVAAAQEDAPVTAEPGGSHLDTVMIVCAAVGVVCILIPIIFGRKKKDEKKRSNDDDEDDEDEDEDDNDKSVEDTEEVKVTVDADSDDW